jgi:hypothetical protein
MSGIHDEDPDRIEPQSPTCFGSPCADLGRVRMPTVVNNDGSRPQSEPFGDESRSRRQG